MITSFSNIFYVKYFLIQQNPWKSVILRIDTLFMRRPCTFNIKRMNLAVTFFPCLEKRVLQKLSFSKPLTQLACVYRFQQTIHSCPSSQCIQMTTYFCLLPHFNSLPLSYIGQRVYQQASLSCLSFFKILISSI